MNQENDKHKQEHVVETASATTSSDNANSGPFAFIVAGISFALVLVLSLGTAGCVSYALTMAADGYASGYGYADDPLYDDYDFDDMDFDDMDFDEFMEQYYNGIPDEGSTSGAQPGNATSATVEEALGFDIAPYGTTVGDEVSASSYAGVPDDVRSYVRGLIALDADYTTKLKSCLNAAAGDEGERAQKLEEAVTLCQEASKALEGLDLPSLEEDSEGEAKDLLGTAKAQAAKRWDCLAEEMGLLQNEEVDTERLWEVDDEVIDATEEAGDLLEDAMAAMAK